MDFRLTDAQLKQREEFFNVCKELEKEKPPELLTLLESSYSYESCWQFHLHCAKEFAKRGWLSLAWPAEYGGQGTMMDRVLFAEARGYYEIPGIDVFGVQIRTAQIAGLLFLLIQ